MRAKLETCQGASFTMDSNPLLPPVASITAAYHTLGNNVTHDLTVQHGDIAQLNHCCRECKTLLNSVNSVCCPSSYTYPSYSLRNFHNKHQHCCLFVYADYQTMVSGILEMVAALDGVICDSTDIPDAPALLLGEPICTGKYGRSRKNVDPDDLAILSTDWKTNVNLGVSFGSSSRTIQCRKILYGIAPPGPPVAEHMVDTDGTSYTVHHLHIIREDLHKELEWVRAVVDVSVT